MKNKVILIAFNLIFLIDNASTDESLQPSTELYSIEGKVYPPDPILSNGLVEDWQIQTRIMGNGGEYRGFLRYSKKKKNFLIIIIIEN